MPHSDWLSCRSEMLEAAITADVPYSVGTWHFSKGVSSIELSKLGEVLEIGSYAELMAGFGLVGEPLPDGPWPERIPVDFTDALATLSDDEIAQAMPAWSRIDEFRGRADPKVLADYVKGLRAFLNENSEPYFLVNSL